MPITHNTLIQPVASLIQNTLHFAQHRIKPYSQLHVSMTSLTKFFTLPPMCPPDPLLLSIIGCQSHGSYTSSSPIGHQTTWLIIISC